MNPYTKYVIRRLIQLVITIFGALLINFIVPRLIPGDPVLQVLERYSERGAVIPGGAEMVAEYRRIFGLDQPIYIQFFRYVSEVFKGNLGYSITYFPTKVASIVISALPWTMGLLGLATIISWIIGTVIGAIVGWKREESRLGQMVGSISLVLHAIPYYLFALILIFLFAYLLPIFPLSGAYSQTSTPEFSLGFIIDVIHHATLPALCMILSNIGTWFLSMRSMMGLLKGEDYILMAEAKGLKKSRIMWRYAFRNALLPQVTGLGLSLAGMVSGAVLTETLFVYPGIGWRLYRAVQELDYPTVQAITLLIVLSLCITTTVLDIIYPLIDPRVGKGGSE